jgi:hypothetical protein
MSTAGDDFLRGMIDGSAEVPTIVASDVPNSGPPVGNTGVGPRVPGGYKFDAETIAARIIDWQQLHGDLVKDGTKLRQAIAVLNATSPDEPALLHAQAAENSVSAAIANNLEMQKYAMKYIENLQKANHTFVAHDEAVANSLPRRS